MVTFEPKDLQTVKILICYLMYELKKPVSSTQLYEICVDSGIINYFFYQEAIDDLIKTDTIISDIVDEKTLFYTLTKSGRGFIEEFKGYAPKSFRDRIMHSALQYYARHKLDNEVKINYIDLEEGQYLHFRCLDKKNDLIDMKLFVPDATQAQLLGEKIMENPIGLYNKIIDLIIANK